MRKVRVSFSFPQEMKKTLEKLAKKSGFKLMGYIKLIMNQEVKRLKGEGK